MEIRLPESVKNIIETLERTGFQAYAVGGCVRDSILGREPQDWDITTSAKPEQVKSLFGRTVDTGLEHGTVTVLVNKEGFEVTTYRIDGDYQDARHPSEVTFTQDLTEDLRRRDFTINAMAYHPQRGLVDAFQGMDDLERGIIRCVGSPQERFSEDALRMLRAIRFSAQLGFELDPETREAILLLKENLQRISAERIQTELVKLLISPHPDYVRQLVETGISGVLFPWLDDMFQTQQNNSHHCYHVGEHTMKALEHVPPDKVLRLTMLFHDMAKPRCCTVDAKGINHFKGHPECGAEMARQVMRQLKFDNDTIDRVLPLIRWHDDNPPLEPKAVRRAIHRAGLSQFPALFQVKRADTMGKNPKEQPAMLAYIDQYQSMYQEILDQGNCLTLKGLALKGRDLLELGYPQGPLIGELLEQLLEHVLESPELNTREVLMKILRERE